MRQSERGFTLVEIMIVVAIIALLAAIAIPNVLRGRTTANESAAIGNMRALVSSLEMYRSVNNVYPDNTANEFKTELYDNATPDFGPPSFNKNLEGAAGDLVQGFIWDYDGVAGGTTYDLYASPQTASTGTRIFHVDETGVISHCTGTTLTKAQINDGSEATIDASVNACD